jgi:hypothetical protein
MAKNTEKSKKKAAAATADPLPNKQSQVLTSKAASQKNHLHDNSDSLDPEDGGEEKKDDIKSVGIS